MRSSKVIKFTCRVLNFRIQFVNLHFAPEWISLRAKGRKNITGLVLVWERREGYWRERSIPLCDLYAPALSVCHFVLIIHVQRRKKIKDLIFGRRGSLISYKFQTDINSWGSHGIVAFQHHVTRLLPSDVEVKIWPALNFKHVPWNVT